jgi:hypothetical protein
MQIALTREEMLIAAIAGVTRRIESTYSNRKDSAGYSDANGWDVDIEGAAAEMALSKYLKRYWGGDCNTFKKNDVSDLQVRSTALQNGSLIIRPEDKETDYFVLVVGRAPQFRVAGYISGKDARKDEWWRSPNGRPGAWFVPQDKLKTIER